MSACALLLVQSAQAQEGGYTWTATSPSFNLQQKGCGTMSNLTFRLSCGSSSGEQRAERRYATALVGNAPVPGLVPDHEHPAAAGSAEHPSRHEIGAYFMLAVERGGRLYVVHGGKTLATGATVGTSVRVNTIHQVGNNHRVYINGSLRRDTVESPGGTFYDKLGAYRTNSGQGPITVEWSGIRFWRRATIPRRKSPGRRCLPVLLLSLASAAACQGPPPAESAPPSAPATRLTGALVSPLRHSARMERRRRGGGRGRPGSSSSPPNPTASTRSSSSCRPGRPGSSTRTSSPETTFHYRVRAYHGPASTPVSVSLPEVSGGGRRGGRPDLGQPPRGGAARRWGPAPAARRPPCRARPRPIPERRSGPLPDPFTWTDHASDEDGFLLEARPEGSADFGVVAVLDPDVNSFGLFTLPGEKRAAYRVRAFYYGRPSNLVRQTTGLDRAGS